MLFVVKSRRDIRSCSNEEETQMNLLKARPRAQARSRSGEIAEIAGICSSVKRARTGAPRHRCPTLGQALAADRGHLRA